MCILWQGLPLYACNTIVVLKTVCVSLSGSCLYLPSSSISRVFGSLYIYIYLCILSLNFLWFFCEIWNFILSGQDNNSLTKFCGFFSLHQVFIVYHLTCVLSMYRLVGLGNWVIYNVFLDKKQIFLEYTASIQVA